jgi:small GTP-binding protein
MEDDEAQITLKIILLGSSQVGKTSIFKRYFSNEFDINMLSTIGVDLKSSFFKFDNQKVKCNYIDTAGQEKFKAITHNYLKGVNGAILVYDVTNKQSFDLIENWVKNIYDNNEKNVSKILFGNKTDLIKERQVTTEEGQKLAKKMECEYFEGSALNGENIKESMNEIAKIAYYNFISLKGSGRGISIMLTKEETNNDQKKKEKKKKGCC